MKNYFKWKLEAYFNDTKITYKNGKISAQFHFHDNQVPINTDDTQKRFLSIQSIY